MKRIAIIFILGLMGYIHSTATQPELTEVQLVNMAQTIQLKLRDFVECVNEIGCPSPSLSKDDKQFIEEQQIAKMFYRYNFEDKKAHIREFRTISTLLSSGQKKIKPITDYIQKVYTDAILYDTQWTKISLKADTYFLKEAINKGSWIKEHFDSGFDRYSTEIEIPAEEITFSPNIQASDEIRTNNYKKRELKYKITIYYITNHKEESLNLLGNISQTAY